MSLSFSSMYYTIKNSAAFSIPMTIGPHANLDLKSGTPLSESQFVEIQKIK